VTKSFEVIGSVFDEPGRDGDFSLMSGQAEHEKTLFIFNDNEEQFRAFVRGERFGIEAGGGNAAIRPLRGLKPPRSAGVPTGLLNGGGYLRLDEATKKVINESLTVIQELLNSGVYERMIFSKDKSSPTLGTGIFLVAEDVKKYIYDALMSMMPS
jgi:hypothetical protein